MRKSATWLAGLSFLALAACSTGAETETFTANLTRAQEVPPAGGFSDADGSATATGSIQLVTDVSVAKFTLTVNGLTGITAAHIHNAAAGANGSIQVYLFDGPTTSATTAFNGQLAKSTFNQATITAGGGTVTYDGLVSAVRGHGAYANVHTTANGGGAIRGNF